MRRAARPGSNALTVVAFLLASAAQAQPDTLLGHITLDEVVISARASGFSVDSFVRQVMDDTTFYHAFLNTKVHPHDLRSDLVVRNKREKETATLFRRGHLERDGAYAELVLDSVAEGGRLRRRNGDFRFLTVEMYDDVFFPKGRYIASNTIRSRQQEIERGSRFDKYKSELKKFMFNPGQEIASVPFIGDELALFSPEMQPHYDYRIWSDEREGHECWVFSADTRTGEEDDTVIRTMSTWFDQGTGQVIAREYHLVHNSLLLDFDITIHVRNDVVDGELVPLQVDYDGLWDIPFSKPEVIRFRLWMSDWEVNTAR
ncbi:MAG: hypothetical protein H6595_02820 [Flavobacteriales bacterium]|nr:hypothetical protein [Flavobacteriales bacterium]